MDFDGFLFQMRIEVESVERAAATQWDLAAPSETSETPGALLVAAAEG